MAIVTAKYEAILYDGTNSTLLATDWLVDARLISENISEMVIEIGGFTPVRYTIPRGHYLIRYSDKNFYQSVSPADYAQHWYILPGGV